MKIKYVLLVLCILAVAGSALPTSQVWAQLCTGKDQSAIDLSDQCCTTAEKTENLCFEAPDWGYAVSAYSSTPNPFLTTLPTWPENGTKYTYQAWVTDSVECKGATWNYWVIRLTAVASGAPVDYVVDTEPPGAQLLLPGQTVPKCTSFKADSDEALLKLNPALNCGAVGTNVYFSITVKEGTPSSIWNRSVITTKAGCMGNDIMGPGYAVPGYIDHREFHCGDDIIVVYYDKFSQAAIDVEMSHPDSKGVYVPYTVCHASTSESSTDDNYPRLREVGAAPGTSPYIPEHFGPGGIGAVFCMDPPPPLYFYNNEAWYGSLTGCP